MAPQKVQKSKRKSPRRSPTNGKATSRAARISARKRPRQERSRVMVEAILQAAAELFAEEGYARTTTNKIASRAGVSVGSLYQYFPNKDSLLAGLLKQHHALVHGVVEDGLRQLTDPAQPLEENLRQMLVALVTVHEDNPVVTRALSPAVLRESPAAAETHNGDAEMLEHVVAVLRSRPDVREGDPVAMAMVLGQTMASLTPWLVHEAPAPLSEGLLEEIVQLLTRFLRAE